MGLAELAATYGLPSYRLVVWSQAFEGPRGNAEVVH